MILGVDRKGIGTHSCRKGCPSYLLGKVYLRAGWSLGNVQDRYIYEGTIYLTLKTHSNITSLIFFQL